MNQYITFYLNNELYAVDILKVQEVIKPIDITTIPQANNYVLGIIKLRDDVITIIDMFGKLGLENENGIANYVIVNINSKLYGFPVTKVDRVITIDDENVEYDTAHQIINKSYIKGFYKNEQKIILILDIERFIGVDKKVA